MLYCRGIDGSEEFKLYKMCQYIAHNLKKVAPFYKHQMRYQTSSSQENSLKLPGVTQEHNDYQQSYYSKPGKRMNLRSQSQMRQH